MRKVNVEDQNDSLAKLVRSKLEDRPVAEAKIQPFAYQSPDIGEGRTRAVVRLVTTDILLGLIQKFEKGGGEVAMHHHTAMDGFWMVLKGQARFHFADGTTRELNSHEGLCVPRDVKYWFEQTGPDALEILQVDAIHPNIPNRIITEDDKKDSPQPSSTRELYDAQTD